MILKNIKFKVGIYNLNSFKNSIFSLIIVISLFHVSYAENEKLLPMAFYTENKGQWEGDFLFKSKLHGSTAFLERNAFTFVCYENNIAEKIHPHKQNGNHINSDTIQFHALKFLFENANQHPKIVASQKSEHYSNYFIGNQPNRWKSSVSDYKEITYKDVYPGIDYKVYSEQNAFSYDINISPHADPASVSFKLEGANTFLENGKLKIKTTVGHAELKAPFAYQIVNNKKVKIACNYQLQNNTLSFLLGDYNHNYSLVIDPTLIFSTFTGSSIDNWGMTATYDSQGNAYTGGVAFGIGYPITTGAFQTFFAGAGTGGDPYILVDISISKFNSTGTAYLYSTFFGGSDNEIPQSMIVNNNNELVLLGRTYSSNFPMLVNSYDPTINGNCDIIVSKFNASGTVLLGSTFVGGSMDDGINYSPLELVRGGLKYNYSDDARGEVGIDNTNNIYVATSTMSSDFPVTTGALQSAFGGGGQDACVFKLNADLTLLDYSTYLGGNEADAAYSLFVSTNNTVYIAGGTYSNGYFDLGASIYSGTGNGADIDGYITHINVNGSAILESKYIGTAFDDQCYFVQQDRYNNVYLYGQTQGNMTISNGVYGNANSGQFIIKLPPDLSSVIFQTTVGSGRGTPDISPTAFLVDNCDNIYISGWGGILYGYNVPTSSTNGLPITSGAYQTSTDGSDFYFLLLDRNAQNLVYATYFGGSISQEHVDGGTSRFDKSGVIYQSVCGGCGSLSDMPTTPGVVSNTNNSNNCNNALIKFKFDFTNTVAQYTPNLFSSTGCAPLTVFFSNNSLNGNSFYWEFGDGGSDTLISPVHTYSNPGTYDVMLVTTNLASCNIRDTAYGVINVLPEILLSPLRDTLLCAGSVLQLEAIAQNATSYSWSPSTGLSDPNISNPVLTLSIDLDYVVTVSNGYCSVSDTLTITAPQNIVASIVDLPTNQGCAPVTINFSNQSSNASDVLWLFGDGSISSQFSPNHTYTSPGTYIVSMIAGNPLSCNLRDTVYDTIIVISPVIIQLQNNISACLGDTIQLLANVQNANSFQWSPSRGLSNDTILNPYLAISASTTYYLSASNGNCSASDSVSINLIPNVQAILTADADSGCAPFIVNFLNFSTNQQSCLWNFDDGNSTISTNPNHLFTAPGNYEVQLIAINPLSCNIRDTATINIFVSAIPQLSPLRDTLVCSGTQLQLSSISSGANSFTWTPSIGLSNPSLPNPIANINSSINYHLEISNGICKVEDSLKITALPAVTASFSASTSSGCAPLTVQFTNTSTGALNYNWNFGDNTANSNQNSPLHIYNQAGIYQIVLSSINPNSCNNQDTASLTITVYEPVNIQPQSDVNLCSGDTVQLFATPGYSYSWTPSNFLSSTTISNPLCFASVNTEYVVTVSNSNCSDVDTVIVNVFSNQTQIISNALSGYFCVGDSVLLTTQQPYVNYFWSNSSQQSSVSVYNSGWYSVNTVDLNGCVGLDSIFIQSQPGFNPVLSNDTNICKGESVAISASGGSIYSWSPSTGLSTSTNASVIANPSVSTDYSVLISDGVCSYYDTINITVFDLPIIRINEDLYIEWGEEVQLIAGTSQSNVFWNPNTFLNCNYCINPISRPDSTITYTAFVENEFGCKASDSVTVFVNQRPSIYVPNCFTPDGDGLNDLFRPECYYIKEIETFIFDRWGIEIYRWSGLEGGWNGKVKSAEPKQDVYVYLIKAKSVFSNKQITLNGTVTLLR